MEKSVFYKCNKCHKVYETKKFAQDYYVCKKCGHYETLHPDNRIKLVVDEGSFSEFDEHLAFNNPIDFPGYQEKYDKAKKQTNLNEAIVTGMAKIEGKDAVIGVMDSRFMMASMGVVVGEKVARAFAKAEEKGCPVILFVASGGARMQEGIFSLMQMAKTSSAVSKFSEGGGLYISVLTNPTTGGVSASFAFLGDIILAEPNALIGFAGKRVIEQTIKEKLPDDFQKSEFLLEHGYIDSIVERKNLRSVLSQILTFHYGP